MAELVSIKRNVDVSPGQAAPAVFHCSQGDVGSKIILGLLNNGSDYSIPSGVTVTIEGSESNGSIFTPISATASGSDITFYLTGEMTAVAGPAICQAVLKSGSNILGTANFTLEVESSPMGADAPPVFTDAGWTWMLNKLNTEFVPALGNETIIDAIDSKADQSDLTELSNTVAGHTGSITVLNNTVNNLNQSVTENRQNIARKLDKNQGTANAGKYLKVGTDGNVETAELDVTTDKTLSIADKAADAKAVGDELADLSENIDDLKSALTAPFAWKDGYYSIATGVFAPQSGTATYHSTEKFLGAEIPNIYNWDLVQSGDSFLMVWNNGKYAGYLMDGVWKKNTTVLDEPPAFSEWAIVLHNEPNYQDVKLIPFSTDAFGKIAVIIPRYSDSRKIAITDTEIIFPALTKIVYDYGYYANSSTITVTRSAPAGGTVSDEVVVFDVASKTIKTYSTINFNIASTERILFTLGIGDKSCSLAGSMYTYNGKSPFMPYDAAGNITITNLNDVSALTEKIIETKYCGNNSKTGLLLIHFSDIHGSTTNIQRIIDLADYYSAYVNDIIHTGDSVATYYADNNPFAIVSGNRVLNTIGNHDCWIKGDTWPHPYNATAAQTYDKFLSPYISSWGVTSAGTNLCYYYKDYSPYNIRLIVLDALHYDSAQETWLTSVLAEAKTNGYSVIIAEHYPPQTGITAFDCTFTSYGISVDPVADPEESAQIERLPESAYTVVDTFMAGGGKFICWLAGHTHYDYIGKVTGHLNQIVVLINCGVVDARYGTDKRVNGTKTQDCLNVVGFDTTNHIIKICRVGISMDWFGRVKNYISINYDNKQIIANS